MIAPLPAAFAVFDERGRLRSISTEPVPAWREALEAPDAPLDRHLARASGWRCEAVDVTRRVPS